ncbi:hypothetical protein V1525DRAFT_118682 [Lipomyces kononenkoae]|uniref:Uncharacterized protein n=1 Tax=Lipomyces kononenkoae TaxID=34357 RepID=A0ACC3T4E8_LIPKO
MSRNAGGSRVRGPNSALTEFLRERGIDANAIRHRYEETLQQQASASSDTVVTVSGSSATSRSRSREVETTVASSSRSRKRTKKKHEDSDDEGEVLARMARPRPGQIEFCAECQCRFTVTAYSKAARDGNGLLCHSCGSKYAQEEKQQKKTQISSRKRKKSIAAALLDKQEFAVPKLQDMCIKLIARYIEDVEMLGDIGDFNMEKIARILSRNRSLKDNTLKLFLNPSIKRLHFWDCSNLCSDSLELIGSYCPLVESLTLSMCGQMTDKVIDYYSTNLRNLHSLTINGGFLITSGCWLRFFDAIGSQLNRFSLANTLRFNRESLEAIVRNCSGTLEELSLSRVGSLKVEDISLLLQLPRLTALELSYMRDAITDDIMIDLLRTFGPQLVTLNLDDSGDLTDKFLLEGVRPHCGRLQNLSLALCDGFTDIGVRDVFKDWEVNNGLINANFSRCVNVGDAGIQALIDHSAKTLVVLNLNSIYKLTSATFQLLASSDCEFLSHLDFGFVHCVGDEEIEVLTERCKSLQLIEAYGNIRITELAKIKRGVKVAGRQSDSL